MSFVIRYLHEPSGFVYALNAKGSWAYTLNPRNATRFVSADAAVKEASKHHWPEWSIHQLNEKAAREDDPR